MDGGHGQAEIVLTQATGVRVSFKRIGAVHTPDRVCATRESPKRSCSGSRPVAVRLVFVDADSAALIEGLMAG